MQAGDQAGHYRIVGPLGKGGMGEVFVAEDARLHRRVALKALPPLLAADPAARERFEREARAVAALNHPNIVTLHSVEEHDGRLFLTMELVDGKPLGEAIPRGGMPLDALLRIGIEVADAMAAAQDQGITHRDLKPGNIMVTPAGRAKVLDFGLAKLKDAGNAPASDDLTHMAPTGELTGEGRIVGTVAYMSPEQAEGKPVDPRSDIFSLGVILHEMATGDRPFKGDTNVSIISAIIKDTPQAVTDSNPNLPADLARIIRRCLAKEPGRRYQTAADLRTELEDLKQVTSSGTVTLPKPVPRRRIPMAAIVAGATVVAALAAGAFLWSRGYFTAAPTAATFTIDRLSRLTATGSASLAAISPDGRYVVHIKSEPGGSSLWMRQTATTSDVRIVAPIDARFDGVSFAPDGNFVYYSTYEGTGGLASLYRVPVLGGTPAKVLDDIDSPVAFSPDGRQIAFLRATIVQGTTALMIADANGSGARALASATPPDRFQSEGLAWSPDGATILTTATSTRPNVIVIVYAIDVRTGAAKPIGDTWGYLHDVQWLPDGRSYLLTAIDLSGANNSQIWRVTYPGGERTHVTNDLNSYAGLSLSADAKSLATVSSEQTAGVYIAQGPDKEPITVSAGRGRADGLSGVAWLPDGRLVYSSTASGLPQLWIANPDGSEAHQLTPTGAPSVSPWSSPDGKWIYFSSYTRAGSTLFRIAPDGSELQEVKTGIDARGPIVSPDGATLYFTTQKSGSPRAMKVPAGGGTPEQLSDAFFRVAGISFDGQRLLGVAWSDERRRSLLAYFDLARRQIEPIDVPTTGASFMPDGSLALGQRVQGKSIIVVRSPQGQVTRTLTAPHPDFIFAGAISKDGRIAFSRGTSTSDVVLVAGK